MANFWDDYMAKRNVDVNSPKWAARSILSKVIFCLLLVIYLPFFVVSFLTWAKMILTIKFKQLIGKTDEKARLGVASRRHKVKDMAAVSPEDELDFLVNRSYGYLLRMCFWTPMELSLFFMKEQNITLISDAQLAYVVLYTVFGHSVRWNKSRNMFHLTMDGLEDIQLFEGFYWEAREIFVSADGKKIIIKMEGGEEFHSDCAPEHRPTFDFAKLHAQICLSFMGPGLSHNEVHFLFPSTMAVMSKRHLDHNGVLFKLLSPHFRFTERINYQALRIQKATSNKRSIDRLFFHWQPFPVTKEIFRETIAKKCKEFYLQKGSQECNQDEETELSEDEEDKLDANGDGESIRVNGSSHKIKKTTFKRTHAIFPPDYVTDESLRKVPYLNFLYKYYKVIRQYVQDLVPFIDKEEWKILSQEVSKYVPRFDKVDMVDGIASFILKVGVVHYCDHGSYTKTFAYQYACMSMRIPFEPFEDSDTWAEMEKDIHAKPDDIKKNPLAAIRQRDVLRTRCFLNIFVDFIGNPKCNLFLPDTEYNYAESGPKMAEEKFKKNLRRLDDNLKAQPRPISLPDPMENEVRSEGMQLVTLDEIIRCVCY